MDAWSVIFWDVGQGDATDIILPDGGHILIDAGPLAKWENPLPWWFAQQGRPVIDLAILTHSHLDHFGGFVTLAGDPYQRIKRFVLLPDAEFRKSRENRNADMNNLLGALKMRKMSGKTDSMLLTEPTELHRANGLTLKMAYPDSLPSTPPADVNRTSMVLILAKEVSGEPLIVWGGDNTLKNIGRTCEGRSPFILMGPHHGHPQDKSKTPAYWRFFRDQLRPKCAFVSVGRQNSHRLPNVCYIKGASCAGVRICCSQLATNCDEGRQLDVYGGSGALGLPKPKESVQCRGALRVYASANSGVSFDKFQASYEGAIRMILPEVPCKCHSLG